MPSPPESVATSLLPHPTLVDYYAESTAKRPFLREMFDATAIDYDRVERLLSLGSGRWYRRQALKRAGLGAGMRVLDVAIGTGLVAREAAVLSGNPANVIGIDPSLGMLQQAVQTMPVRAVMAVGEQLPFADGQFDFLSMGYALRHLGDLRAAFAEYRRVLKPGGRLCVLEITAPTSKVGRWALRAYMRRVVPLLTRVMTGRAASQVLWQYYWDTIEACVLPAAVMEAIEAARFEGVERHVELGIFSEYTGVVRG